MGRSSTPRRGGSLLLAAKVPEITVLFWIIKVLTTGMGEAMSDFLGQKSVPLAGAVGILVPTPVTRRAEVAAATHAVEKLAAAVDDVLSGRW